MARQRELPTAALELPCHAISRRRCVLTSSWRARPCHPLSRRCLSRQRSALSCICRSPRSRQPFHAGTISLENPAIGGLDLNSVSCRSGWGAGILRRTRGCAGWGNADSLPVNDLWPGYIAHRRFIFQAPQ
jgi:hypothetical protein